MRNWLRRIRLEKGYSEAKVAKMAKIAQPFYHCIETGEKNPSVATAKAIAEVLGFSWILFFEDGDSTGQEVGQSDDSGICGAAGDVGRDERSVPALEH